MYHSKYFKNNLGNFKKISNTEFHFKKTLQFAQVTVDVEGKVQSVRYQDKQRIENGDILPFEDKDFEIVNINTDVCLGYL